MLAIMIIRLVLEVIARVVNSRECPNCGCVCQTELNLMNICIDCWVSFYNVVFHWHLKITFEKKKKKKIMSVKVCWYRILYYWKKISYPSCLKHPNFCLQFKKKSKCKLKTLIFTFIIYLYILCRLSLLNQTEPLIFGSK